MFQLYWPSKLWFMVKAILLFFKFNSEYYGHPIYLSCDNNIILTSRYDRLFETDII